MSDDLINFFESQIELENKIVQSVSDALDNIDNLAVKTALRGISLDSSKHAEMYRSAIALLTSSSAALNEEQLDLQRKVCLLYTSPSPRDRTRSRMPSSA